MAVGQCYEDRAAARGVIELRNWSYWSYRSYRSYSKKIQLKKALTLAKPTLLSQQASVKIAVRQRSRTCMGPPQNLA